MTSCCNFNQLFRDNDIVPRYFQSRNGIVKATTFDSRERYATFGELSFSGDGNKKTGEPTAKGTVCDRYYQCFRALQYSRTQN